MTPRVFAGTQNAKGQWVEAIPEPLWVGFMLRKSRCRECGQTWWDNLAYKHHYVYKHIWSGE